MDAGITFVGPKPAAIRAMGLKREAKALVGARGVPLVPGFDGGDQSTATLKKKALELGLPVIFKPSAGGGGKGMKIARAPDELREAIESGRREAQNAFGDPTLDHREVPGAPAAPGDPAARATSTATWCTCSSASAASSGGTRRWSKRRPRWR